MKWMSILRIEISLEKAGSTAPEARQMDLNNNASGTALSTLSGTCSANCTEAARNDQLEVYMGK